MKTSNQHLMKKKLLFVIHRLDAGGAEKALVSLLNCMDYNKYDVTLISMSSGGLFLPQVPQDVHIKRPSSTLVAMTHSLTEADFWRYANLKDIVRKIKYVVRQRKSKSKLSHYQERWDIWKGSISEIEEQYDVAISFMLLYCNYYVIDKVHAKKKILWMHHDYSELKESHVWDFEYFKKSDYTATISEVCKQKLVETFPAIKEKFVVVENITSKQLLMKQAEQQPDEPFFADNGFKIISIGRLCDIKGIDLAIEAAKILKDAGKQYKWYIIGEGPNEGRYRSQIKRLGLEDNFYLLGIKSNPYPFIKYADIFVMPSRSEGKSIALDEAKLLEKPIVVTKYPSVYDAISDGETGLLAEISPDSIADNIIKLYESPELRKKLSLQLHMSAKSNEKEVIELFDSIVQQ